MEEKRMEICELAGVCGGCLHQGTPYEEQLAAKEREVHALFDKAGITPVKFDPIEGCPSPYRYRNKMEYTFGDLVKDGPLELGMHKKRQFMSVVTVDHCQLVPEDFNRVLRYTLDFCLEHAYPKYNKKSHQGLLRNLVVRCGVRTGELLVNIVTASPVCGVTFDAEGWCQGLSALNLDGRIAGVLHTEFDGLADKVGCDRLHIVFGQDYYMEHLLDLDFKVNEFSFFQTNVEAVERLYSEAVALIDEIEGKTVYDLYCGTGTISQVMARRAKQVIGVELVQDSVDAAIDNAALNGLSNCRFLCGDVYKVLDKAGSTEETELPAPDVIVVDPPRVGMSREAVDKIAGYGVPQIVYVSCNPKTLVQNLAQFKELGYETVYAKPYDNFPMTKHVECVVLMSRADR